MITQFNDIVVPADLSQNTGIAINKALELAEPGATIHLISVQKLTFIDSINLFFSPGKKVQVDSWSTQLKLLEWRKLIETNSKKLKGCIWITAAKSFQSAIEKIAIKVAADLIIISKEHQSFWPAFHQKISCSRIAKNTGIAVLTIGTQSLQNEIRKIVVPMHVKVPEEKINILNGIGKKFKLRIFLVSFSANDSESTFNAVAISKTGRWLSTSIGCPVEHTILQGSNSSAALLRYAKRVEGNTLLVFAGSEAETGIAKRDISDIIKPGSNIDVLMIKQKSVS